MDPNARIADRLIEVTGPPAFELPLSLDHKRNAFIANSNDLLNGLTADMINSTHIINWTDRLTHRKERIVRECNECLTSFWFKNEMFSMNLKLNSFGEKGNTRVVNRGKTGVQLDLYAAISFAVFPKGVYRNKTNQFISLLARVLFSDRTLLPGRLIQPGNFTEANALIFSVDHISVRFTVCLKNAPLSPYKASQILEVYERYDTRLAYLSHFVHRWLTDLNNHHGKTLSTSIPSLSKIALLVVHFLQFYDILPEANALHEDIPNIPDQVSPKFHGFQRITKKDFETPASRTLVANVGVLFLLFCDYYTEIANLGSHLLVVGPNALLPKANYHRRRLKDLLVINDVFDDISPENRVSNVSRLSFFLKAARDLIRLRFSVAGPFDISSQMKRLYIPHDLEDAPSHPSFRSP